MIFWIIWLLFLGDIPALGISSPSLNETHQSITDFPPNSVETSVKTVTSWATGENIKENPVKRCANFLSSDPSIIYKIKTTLKCTHQGAVFDELMRFINDHLNYITCSNFLIEQRNSKILYCSIVIRHQICLQAVGKEFDFDAIPSFLAVQAVISSLCYFNHALKTECLTQQMKTIQHCVREEVNSVFEMNGMHWIYGTIHVCRHFEIQKLCLWEELKSCNERMGSVMAILIDVLQPPVCTSADASLKYSFCPTFLCLIFLFFLKSLN